MFKIGFSTLGCPSYTVEQVAAMARDHRFDGVEIRFIRGEVELAALEEFDSGRIAETRKVFDDAGVQVNCIDTSVRFSSADAAERTTQREVAKINCEIANGLGAPYIRVFGGSLPTGTDFETGVRPIAEGLGEVAEASASAGVTTLLETHDDFCTSDRVGQLLEHTSDRLQVLWDFLHTYRNGESAEHTWAALGPRIRQVHVKDAATADADGFDLVLTGQGVVPLRSVFDLLQREGFDGYVDFEWEKAWHPEIAEPEVAIPQFRTAVDGLLAA
jgi:sugar phosphate isomerase/epimerase